MTEFNFNRYNIEDSKGTLHYTSAYDTRKPTLTLRHLNKMKKFKAMREIDNMRRSESMTLMYGAPADDMGGGGGMEF